MVDKKITENGKVMATKTINKSGKIVSEEHIDEPITAELLDVSSVMGSITFGKREVVNTGNFETVTIEITATLPIGAEVSKKDMDATLKKVRAFVLSNVDSEIDEIRAELDRGTC